jgi:beta-1,2-mannobiose phosphorylase / 1,2-beta-oligomannan phosphorylase
MVNIVSFKGDYYQKNALTNPQITTPQTQNNLTLKTLSGDTVSFSGRVQPQQQPALLEKLGFTGKKQTYDWHEKDNWWLEVQKAAKSKAKDGPLILRPKMFLKPTNEKSSWQNLACYNPGAIYDKLPGDKEAQFHVLYRSSDCNYPAQPSVSRWGMASSKDGLKIDKRTELPIELPKTGYEVWGIEDPRITKIDDTYYIAYCAYSPEGPRLGLMSTKNFKNEYEITQYGVDGLEQQGTIRTPEEKKKLETLVGKKFPDAESLRKALEEIGLHDMQEQVKHITNAGFKRYGLIGPNMEDKDVVLFPKKINGKFAMMHRLGHDIQIAYFDKPEDLNADYWKKYLDDYRADKSKYTIMDAKFGWESKLGAGPPPVETDDGWLFIYHTSKDDKHSGKRIYTAGIAILDKDDPTIVKHRVPHPTMVPLNNHEKKNSICPDKWVVFPTGIAEKDGELFIYSGAGDKYTEVYRTKKDDLVNYAKQFDADGNKIAGS